MGRGGLVSANPILADALRYAAAGFKVGPYALRGGDKIPLGIAHGFSDWSSDPREVRLLFNRHDPAAYNGVGVIPGSAGFVVIDVDVKNGATGPTALRDLVSAYGGDLATITETVTTITPSGGRHLWCRAEDLNHRQKDGVVLMPDGTELTGVGLDLRQNSGFVPVPAIEGPDNGYRCEEGPFLETVGDGAIPAPAWLARAWPAKDTTATGARGTWTAEVDDYLDRYNAGRFTDAGLEREYLELIDRLRTATSGRHDLVLAITGKLAGHLGTRDVDAEKVVRETIGALEQSRRGENRNCAHEVVEAFAGSVRYMNENRITYAELPSFPVKPNPNSTDGETPGRPFGLRTVAEISAEVDAMPPTRWLWRRVWPADAYGVVGAAPKVGKTYMALDAAVSVAAGTRWLGMFEPETCGPVIAFMGEGGARKMTRRGRAVAEHHGVEWDTLPIHLAERVPKLTADQQVAALAVEVDRVRPALVIIDPLYLAAAGVDSAKLNDVGDALEGAQHACQTSGAALMIVHHYNRSGKTGTDAMSGAGPTEWGRVLIGLDTKVTSTDTVTERTDKHVEMSVKGDEVAERAYRYRLQVWTDDPDDLGSAMHYSVEAIATDAATILDGMNKTQRRTLAAVNSRADWMSKREIGDVLANDGQGSPLKERTILDALKYLVEVGRIEVHRDGHGTAGSWRSIVSGAGEVAA